MEKNFDLKLDRMSKIAGILLPVVVGCIGAWYTVWKDRNDEAAQKAQAQYANFSALLPLMLSNDDRQVSTALDIYKQEAIQKEAPLSLAPLVQQIGSTKPQFLAQAQAAEQAASVQAGKGCKQFPDGLFLQVANDKTQLKNGQALAARLASVPGLPPIPGAQRVDAEPEQTQLRYYFSDANNVEAGKIIAALQQIGFSTVIKKDLSTLYLKGCSPPPTFELWIGANITLDGKGAPRGE